MRNDRYESLDGIKGFALIGIIWYHLSQRSLPGGFIGVDVFFTVSGFLLALSVLREIDRTGRLRLGNFYLRRLSRLWPAMAFMIAGSVALLAVPHDERQRDTQQHAKTVRVRAEIHACGVGGRVVQHPHATRGQRGEQHRHQRLHERGADSVQHGRQKRQHQRRLAQQRHEP